MEENRNPNTAQEVPAEPEDDPRDAKPARRAKWLIIAGVLIVFLAAAVFLGARLLKPQAMEGPGDGGGMYISQGGPGGKSVRLNMLPAAEVPQEEPTARGIFVRREDKSIFIGTGNISLGIRKSSDNAPAEVVSDYDGPVVEVVANHQTQIYQDITEMTPPEGDTGSVVDIQQKVKDGSLDDLTTNSMVTVWGEKQGDRFIAKVIVFR